MKFTSLKRITVLLLLTLLVFSLSLSLVSCSDSYGGTAEIKTKEELLSAAEAETESGLEYASDYLDAWGFPRFSLSKLHGLENVFISKFVNEVGDSLQKAKETAVAFVESYYDETELSDVTAVTDALIHAYVSTMNDRYSIYRTADEYSDYSTDMSGSFVGIGVTVRYSQETSIIEVVGVNSGSGAEEAGILPGDFITGVDGKSVEEIGYDATVSAIRGEEGTRVTITVLRGERELSFEVTRRRVEENTVSYYVKDKIAYITVTGFKSNSFSQFKEAIDETTKAGVKGIVYDLRGNPGGYLSAVTDMLAYIAPKGTQLVSFTNDYASPTIAKDTHVVALPSVVICNGGTASAGELFTAAIRDFAALGFFDAKIVGETTFGKGIMQNTYGFTDGSAITLTVAYYNPPSGINYHGKGIVPDVEVLPSDEGDAQLDAATEQIKMLIANN